MSDTSQFNEGYRSGQVLLGRLYTKATGKPFSLDTVTLHDVVIELQEADGKKFNLVIKDNCTHWYRAGLRCFISDLKQAIEDVNNDENAKVLENITINL